MLQKKPTKNLDISNYNPRQQENDSKMNPRSTR